ncbi:MAG: hypothetical protein DMF68_18455 [Acidobacteria bacterium]|nr:MAG: hypothetical protein DMF68_18455 [Acidobacteriota bacterium]
MLGSLSQNRNEQSAGCGSGFLIPASRTLFYERLINRVNKKNQPGNGFKFFSPMLGRFFLAGGALEIGLDS